MINNNTIGVLILVYNMAKGHKETKSGKSFLEECLDSVKRQTYKNWVAIITDDGSTDNSLSILNDYIKAKKCFLNQNIPILFYLFLCH